MRDLNHACCHDKHCCIFHITFCNLKMDWYTFQTYYVSMCIHIS